MNKFQDVCMALEQLEVAEQEQSLDEKDEEDDEEDDEEEERDEAETLKWMILDSCQSIPDLVVVNSEKDYRRICSTVEQLERKVETLPPTMDFEELESLYSRVEDVAERMEDVSRTNVNKTLKDLQQIMSTTLE